jgi:hypothetical protein
MKNAKLFKERRILPKMFQFQLWSCILTWFFLVGKGSTFASTDYLGPLPNELIFHVMTYLSVPDFLTLSQVSKKFRHLSADQKVLNQFQDRDPKGWRLHLSTFRKLALAFDSFRTSPFSRIQLSEIGWVPMNGQGHAYRVAAPVAADLSGIIHGITAISLHTRANRYWGSALHNQQDPHFVSIMLPNNTPKSFHELVDELAHDGISTFLKAMSSEWIEKTIQDHPYTVCKIQGKEVGAFFNYALAQLIPRFQSLETIQVIEPPDTDWDDFFETCISGEPAAVELLFAQIRAEI